MGGHLAYQSSRKIIVGDDGKDYVAYAPAYLYAYDYGTTQVTMPENAIEYVEEDDDDFPSQEE